MVSILIRFLIPDYKNTTSPAVRQKYGVLSGFVGIFLNIFLFSFKLMAGMISSSIAITADAFNNLSDAGSSIITLIGFRMAGQKPDSAHPYGHGRVEYVSGLLVSIAILLMAIELLRTSFTKILHPSAVSFSPLVLVILLLSILVKLYMCFYNRNIGRRINSTAMMATATDSLSDTLATTAVLIATITAHLTGITIDGYCGMLVGFFVFFAGLGAAKDTINPLLGKAPDPVYVEQIRSIVSEYEEILGIHDLRVHDYGPGRCMISLHAEVPAKGDILALHDTIDVIEKRLQNELHCEAIIHMDPIMNDDEQTLQLKAMCTDLLMKINADLTLHDFRIVKGPTHTNLIFDVVAPYSLSYSNEELKQIISDKLKEIDPQYYAVLQIDHP